MLSSLFISHFMYSEDPEVQAGSYRRPIFIIHPTPPGSNQVPLNSAYMLFRSFTEYKLKTRTNLVQKIYAKKSALLNKHGPKEIRSGIGEHYGCASNNHSSGQKSVVLRCKVG